VAKAERDGERSLTEFILSKAKGFEMTEEKREMPEEGRDARFSLSIISSAARNLSSSAILIEKTTRSLEWQTSTM
jgi:hypothetical protein